MNTRPYTAWFDQTTRYFRTLPAAKQWIVNRLGRNNTTDDYGIQHLDPTDQTVIPDLLGADATPHPADPLIPPPADSPTSSFPDAPAIRDITHGDEVPKIPQEGIASAVPTSSPVTSHSRSQDHVHSTPFPL